MTSINNTSRIIVAASSLALLATFFVPIWRIDLFAPQYPEGLTMKIWLDNLTGDIEIINGLNHYIGMRHISVDMFPEFSFMGYIVVFYIILGLLVAYSGKMAILFWYLVFTGFGGVFSMYDFYRWGYEYGHNLDEAAAIKVPGLSYQPPLIGHKRLLNFDAYSQPDVGGWIIVIAASVMVAIWIIEWYRHHKKSVKPVVMGLIISTSLSILQSCTPKAEPFKYGSDICYTCKMGIIDAKFGSELVTTKGKVYKFDDLGCMIRLMKSGMIPSDQVSLTLVANFEKENDLLDVMNCSFVTGENIKSPMNFQVAAFQDAIKAQAFADQVQGRIVDWKTIYEKID